MGKTKSKRVRHFDIIGHQGGIQKSPNKLHNSAQKRRYSGSGRDYKKSVSNSLVYRSLKLDNDGYIGFKVTYSGKGTKVNYDRSRLSIVLIPDIHFIRAYRPFAGAIARETKGEVIVCTYSKQSGYNERLVSLIVNRTGYVKSKLRRVNIISENEGILELFKQRLAEIDRLSDRLVPVSSNQADESFEDAPSSPNEEPAKVTVDSKEVKLKKRRTVELIRIRRREEKQAGSGSFSNLVKSVISRLGSLFVSSSPGEDRKGADISKSVFEVKETKFKVNEKLHLSNASHCDIIAKEMLWRNQ